jgi:hypothetical protein
MKTYITLLLAIILVGCKKEKTNPPKEDPYQGWGETTDKCTCHGVSYKDGVKLSTDSLVTYYNGVSDSVLILENGLMYVFGGYISVSGKDTLFVKNNLGAKYKIDRCEADQYLHSYFWSDNDYFGKGADSISWTCFTTKEKNFGKNVVK